jgi:hypothetical protein
VHGGDDVQPDKMRTKKFKARIESMRTFNLHVTRMEFFRHNKYRAFDRSDGGIHVESYFFDSLKTSKKSQQAGGDGSTATSGLFVHLPQSLDVARERGPHSLPLP